MDPAFRQRLLRFGGWFAFALLLLFSCVTKGSTRFFTWPWVLYGQLLLLFPIVWLGVKLVTQPLQWPRVWTFLAAPAVAIGVSVMFSRRPDFSFEAALFLWSALAWCGLVALHVRARLENANEHEWRQDFRIGALAMSAPIVVSMVLWIIEQLPAWRTFGGLGALRHLSRNLHPFGHWNYVGGYALLALPSLMALALIERGRWRAVWTVSAFITFATMLSSMSRGAVLGLIASMATALGLAIAGRFVSRRSATILASVALLLGAGLFATNARLRNVVLHPQSIFLPNEGDVQRLGMLQAGELLFKESPWVGHGPGMTPFVYPEVRAQVVGGVETAYQLHNGPLEIGVNSGVIGLLGWALLAAAITAAIWRWLRTADSNVSPEWKILALGSAAAVTGYAVMFCTDYQFDVIGILAALGLHAGILLAAPAETLPQKPCRNLPLLGTAPYLAALLTLIVLIPGWRARQTFWGAWWNTPPDNPMLVIEKLRNAVELAPRNPHFLNHLGFRLGATAQAINDEPNAGKLLQEARESFNKSLALDPAQEPVHAALGWLWLNLNAEKSEHHFRTALALLPDRDTLHTGLALSLLGQGKESAAIRELVLECLVNPAFIASPVWQQSPFSRLRASVEQQLPQYYTFVLDHPATPEWRKPDLVYAAAFARWWSGGALPEEAELSGATLSQKQAFAFLKDPTKASLNAPPALDLLYSAHQTPNRAEFLLRASIRPSYTDNAIAGALARLTLPQDFASFLRSPAAGGRGVYQQQIARGHFSIMYRMMDGPGYLDFAPRLNDAFVNEFLSSFFPIRGAIPGPVLVELQTSNEEYRLGER